MKKILSLGIASAVLAMTALSASAGIVLKTDDGVVEGATIKVDFVADSNINNVTFKTTASGLKLVDATSTFKTDEGSGSVVIIADDKAGMTAIGLGARANEVILTQTYTVTAKADEAISVAIEGLEGITATVTPLTVVVKPTTTSSDTTSSTTSSDTTSSTTSSTTTSSDTTSSTTSSTTTSSTTSTTDPGTNPPTGVALAVFPAVIAGAAVVVAKKKRG